MPCPLRVVVVAASALLLAFVALAPGTDAGELRVECCDGETSSEVRTPLSLRTAAPRLTLRVQKAAAPGSWAARRRRVSELMRSAWELASGRLIWRALLQARAGTLRRRNAPRVARTAEAHVYTSR